jgi:YidC/Oxa1 family membrane protein insertase
MQDKKNFIIMILACALIWLGLDLVLKPKDLGTHTPVQQTQSLSGTPPVANNHPSILPSHGPKIVFKGSNIEGSLDLKGALVRQCFLKQYRETTDANSAPVALLSRDEKMYVAQFGWRTQGGSEADMPNENTLWSSSQSELNEQDHLTLSWKNARGIEFFIDFYLDKKYGYTVKAEQRVVNTSDAPIDIAPVARLIRQGPVATSGHSMFYEGPIGMANGKLQEPSYKNVTKLGQVGDWMHLTSPKGKRGWLGITDKYWLAALIPHDGSKGKFSAQGEDFYQAECQGPVQRVLPGEKVAYTTDLFLGPKKLSLLDDYERTLSMDHFDLAVDFGWFYFITKPMFHLLSGLQKLIGNFGLAILIMTVGIKVLFFPLSARSFRAMSRMRQLQPQIQGLKSRFGDDKARLNQAMMELYKREKINPVSGCLPMLIQIPIFFSLYKVLFISIEMRHAPFWGWIQDLSAPDPTSVFSGFGLLPLALPAWLHVGIWPILMGVTMMIQQKMNSPHVTDSQQKVMLTYVMPGVFTFMLAQFPVGLVIYWTWSNFLTIGQQWFMMRYYRSVS